MLNDNEKELFAKEMEGVRPLASEQSFLLKPNMMTDEPGKQYRREAANFSAVAGEVGLSLVLRHKLTAADWLSFKRDGIQTAVFKNLRVGKYPHEASLNLNQKKPREAREELLQFVGDCRETNIRSVLIFFGQGASAVLLKSYLNQWLPEIADIQAFHTAQRHHGGSSAVYILLRKSEQKRLENRERHASKLGHTL